MAKRTSRTRGNAERGAGGGTSAHGLAPYEQQQPATSTNPFAFMRRVAEEMDRLFDLRGGFPSGVPRLGFSSESGTSSHGWAPAVEVTERGGQLVIRADLPGLGKDDVKVEVREDAIAIQGER